MLTYLKRKLWMNSINLLKPKPLMPQPPNGTQMQMITTEMPSIWKEWELELLKEMLEPKSYKLSID
jgi:hypothetical protein